VLGGVRVKLDEQSPEGARVIALIHGCTGPLFFAAAVGMVVVTSRRWLNSPAVLAVRDSAPERRTETVEERRAKMARLWRLAIITTGLAYLQVVVGAVLRHSPLMLAESAGRIFQIAVYFHLLLAVAVMFHVLLVAHRCFWKRISRMPSMALVLLIGVQLLLGVSTWLLKYGVPEWAAGVAGETGHLNRASGSVSAAIITAHGAVGSLIVALCVAITLHVGRRVGVATRLKQPAAHLTSGAPA
jgi:cytochrome c oxidase assembly protein subunit 15